MTEKVQKVPASAIARLLNVPESKLEHLAKSGIMPKPSSGKYELDNSVRGYINHLRGQHESMDQAAVARHLDMSDRNLRDVMRGLDIEWPSDPDEIRIAYIRDLREKAAGRGGEAQQQLTLAKIRQANIDSDFKEMQIMEKAGKLLLSEDVEPIMLRMVTAARQELLTLPGKIASDMKMLHGIDIDESLVTERIHDSLKHLATSLQEDDADPDESGAESVDAATEDDND